MRFNLNDRIEQNVSERKTNLLQAARNITGAQQGPPAPQEVIDDIVNLL